MPARPQRDPRTVDLGRIHALKRDLALDDDQYRTMLHVVARVDSAADLDSHGRRQVIAHLQAHAKRAGLGSGKSPHKGRPHNADADNRRELRKIEALLTDAGRPWAYADEVLQRQTQGRVQRLAFATPRELIGVITALERDAIRRLSEQLAQALGQHYWLHAAQSLAEKLFDYPHTRSVETSAQALSQVLRWWEGRLPAACAWPVKTDKGQCCRGCQGRLRRSAPAA